MASVNYITQLTKKRKAVIYFEFMSFLCNLGIFLSIPIFISVCPQRVLFITIAVCAHNRVALQGLGACPLVGV
jgi:Tfp pilus assembly protein PilZ